MSISVDNELLSLLLDVGLDAKEARLYLTILGAGRLSVSEAAESAFISRTNAYDVVKRLSRRGLLQTVEVSNAETSRNQTLVQANDLDGLLGDLDLRRNRIESLIPLLRAVRSKGTLPKVRYLEGEAGIRRGLFESLEWSSPVYGILSMADLMSVPGPAVMAEYIEGRRERGLELRVV